MKYKESRDYFYVPKDQVKIKSDQIKFVGNDAQFPKSIFSKSIVDRFTEEKHQSKFSAETKLIDVTDSDLDFINKNFATSALRKEDITIFKWKLAHNSIDRDNERFTEDYLKCFVEPFPSESSIIGKSFLKDHDKYDTSILGLVYDATLTNEGGKLWLTTKTYHLNSTDAETIAKMKAGIYRHVSIGFWGGSIEPVKTSNGEVQYWEWKVMSGKRKPEALEQSLVYLGAQPGATSIKGVKFSPDNGEFPVMSQESLTIKGIKDMRLFVESAKLGISKKVEVNPSNPEQVTPAEIEKAFVPVLEEAVEKAVTEITGKLTAKDAELKTATDSLKSIKEKMINRILAGERLSKKLKDDAVSVDARTAELNGKTIEVLHDEMLQAQLETVKLTGKNFDGTLVDTRFEAQLEGGTATEKVFVNTKY